MEHWSEMVEVSTMPTSFEVVRVSGRSVDESTAEYGAVASCPA